MTDIPVALVTGASGDLGRAIAVHLSRRGIAVIGTGRSAAGLERLREALGTARLETIQQDVTKDSAPHDAVDLARRTFGRLDFLVNNAGFGKPKPVHETTDQEFDAYLNVHLRAAFRYCREAMLLLGPDSGIVNIASTFAVIGGMRGGAYSAAKAGVVGLTLHMAAQYGAQGIRSNAVAPGVFRSAMTEYAWTAERFKRMNFEMTPATRTCTTDDVAATVAFLCSPEASFINGQVIAIDGGWSSTKYLSEEAVSAQRVPPQYPSSPYE